MNNTPINLPGTNCQILPEYSLANRTTYRVGGPAEWYSEPRNLPEIEATFNWLETQQIPLTLLGAGSNLLISDRGLPGLVLCTRNLRHYQFNPETGHLTAGAGAYIHKLAWQAAKFGFKGLEWAVGIPGTVGGAVVMNAGAHNNCTADYLVSALIITPQGKIERVSVSELNYSYRKSVLQGQQLLVLEATFKLEPGFDKTEIMQESVTNLLMRKNSQPYDKPSCGSVFRNPQPMSAGWLIENSGLKGYQIGDAQVAYRHANFILNCGHATANDIFRLIGYVQQKVKQHFSVLLEPEVKILGEF